MNISIDVLTDKIIEAINGNKGNWYLTNSILKEEIPRIVTNEIRQRVDAFVNEYKSRIRNENA